MQIVHRNYTETCNYHVPLNRAKLSHQDNMLFYTTFNPGSEKKKHANNVAKIIIWTHREHSASNQWAISKKRSACRSENGGAHTGHPTRFSRLHTYIYLHIYKHGIRVLDMQRIRISIKESSCRASELAVTSIGYKFSAKFIYRQS